eukprot:SAG22_NODE_1775_length_3608_cov_2.261613_2_plen_224_part_00
MLPTAVQCQQCDVLVGAHTQTLPGVYASAPSAVSRTGLVAVLAAHARGLRQLGRVCALTRCFSPWNPNRMALQCHGCWGRNQQQLGSAAAGRAAAPPPGCRAGFEKALCLSSCGAAPSSALLCNGGPGGRRAGHQRRCSDGGSDGVLVRHLQGWRPAKAAAASLTSCRGRGIQVAPVRNFRGQCGTLAMRRRRRLQGAHHRAASAAGPFIILFFLKWDPTCSE